MDPIGELLAEIPDFGRVYDCGDCGNIHITVGPATITLAPEAYQQFVTLIHSSIFNYESWCEKKKYLSQPSARRMRGDCGFTCNPS